MKAMGSLDSPQSVAARIRRLMELEGCYFSPWITAKAMEDMGGGVGIVRVNRPGPLHPRAYKERDLLVEIPSSTIITVEKARLHLALVEVEYQRRYPLDCRPRGSGEANSAEHPSPFVLRFYASAASDCSQTWSVMCGVDPKTTPLALSQEHVNDLRETEARLAKQLSPAETLASYVVLLGALFGRVEWDRRAVVRSSLPIKTREGSGAGLTIDAKQEREMLVKEGRHRIYFVHDNAWMKEWIFALPPLYDNGLEMVYRRMDMAGSSGPPTFPPALQHELFGLSRQAEKVEREQQRAFRMYENCLSVLQCLRCLPIGALLSSESPAADHEGPRRRVRALSSSMEAEAAGGGPVSFTQFLWGLNTLATRGFSYPSEVWALMPYVDYFNYSLNADMAVRVEQAAIGRRLLTSSTSAHRRLKGRGQTAEEPPVYIASFRENTWGSGYPVSSSSSISAASAVRPGEQLFFCYGSYSDYELLLWYGFILRSTLLPSLLLDQHRRIKKQRAPQHEEEEEAARKTETTSLSLDSASYSTSMPSDGLGGAGLPSFAARYAERERLIEGMALLWCSSTRQQLCAAQVKSRGSSDAFLSPSNWLRCLQTAYCVVLSPLQDIQGEWDAEEDGTSWLSAMIHRYLATEPLSLTRALASVPSSFGAEVPLDSFHYYLHQADAEAAVRLDEQVRQWVSHAVLPHLPLDTAIVRGYCGLGCLHPTLDLQAALVGLARRIDGAVPADFAEGVREAWRASMRRSRRPPHSGTAPRNEDEAVVVVALVRALGWMEWRSSEASPVAALVGSPTREVLSACTLGKAVQVSEDSAALLYALSLRGSGAMLLRYAMGKNSTNDEDEREEEEVCGGGSSDEGDEVL